MSWFKDLMKPGSPLPAPYGAPLPPTTPVAAPSPPAPAPAAAPELACSFCGTSRRDVNKLIAGPNDISICDACVAACADVLENGDNGESVKCARNLVVRELAGLAQPIDFGASRKLVAAALVLAGGDGPACRKIASTAALLGDSASAALAMASIREADRTTDDRVNEALHHEHAGAQKTALALLDAIDPARFTAEHHVIVPLHRVSLRLAAGVAERKEAQVFDRFADEVESRLATLRLRDTYLRDLRREILLARTRAARLLGDLARALALLDPHLAAAPEDTTAWALLYEIHADGGDRDAALAAKTKALSLTHPEGWLAENLRSRTP